MIAAWIEDDDAVLRFPYDERLKGALRAIPGRRWEPLERVWRLPLSPENAVSLERWIGESGTAAQLSEALERALGRLRAERDGEECLIELVRFDERHWLSVCDDIPAQLLARLLAHPRAIHVTACGRGLLPADEQAAALVHALRAEDSRVWLSAAAERALAAAGAQQPAAPARALVVDVARRDGQPVFVLDGQGRALPAQLAAQLELSLASWRAIVQHGPLAQSAACRRCVAAIEAGSSPPPALLERSRAHAEPAFVLAAGYDSTLLARFASLAAALPWRPPAGAVEQHALLPAMRADPFCVAELDAFIAAHDVRCAADAFDLLAEIRDEHARAAGIVALSTATDAPLPAARLGGELMPFQRAGVRYLLERRRAFLADEQGLGKTIEAIAALEHDGAYPAIVVCPASLKLNWQRELGRWLPHRSTALLQGRRVGDRVPAADVTIVNYDIVAGRLAQLRAIAPRALILDESHYLKNPRAKRTLRCAAWRRRSRSTASSSP